MPGALLLRVQTMTWGGREGNEPGGLLEKSKWKSPMIGDVRGHPRERKR